MSRNDLDVFEETFSPTFFDFQVGELFGEVARAQVVGLDSDLKFEKRKPDLRLPFLGDWCAKRRKHGQRSYSVGDMTGNTVLFKVGSMVGVLSALCDLVGLIF